MATDETRKNTPPTTDEAEAEGHGRQPPRHAEPNREPETEGHGISSGRRHRATPETDSESEVEGHGYRGP